MNKITRPDLSSPLENKPIKILWNVGPHLVCIIDKKIVEELKIEEGCFCEQSLTKEGAILLKIKK